RFPGRRRLCAASVGHRPAADGRLQPALHVCPITTDMTTRRPSAMMETAKAIRFLESVASFRPMIRIFGGEPFLHPAWPEIFAAAVANGLPITVVTNGTRLVGRAEDLVRSGLLAVGISVDPPAVNDTYRGNGTFAI